MVDAPTPEMANFRTEIDILDRELIALMGRRFEIIRAVADHKKQAGLPPVLQDRVEQVKDKVANLGVEYNLDAEFMRSLYTVIIDYAHVVESEIINDN